MPHIDLRGIFPPIATPFVDGEVAYDQLAANVEKWSRTGLKGLVALGSNGEAVFLSGEEKRKVLETVVQAAPADMPVIAGTGCESARETIRLTEDCARLGAKAALVGTPHYYRAQMTDAALIRYFTTVAQNSPVPIILYNVPRFTGINLPVGVVAELSRHPNIIGLKESSGNLAVVGDYLHAAAADFHVLVGTAGVLFAGLSLGCTGAIAALANVAPEACVQIYRMVAAEQYAEARKLQLRMIPVNKAVTTTYGVRGLKAALDMLGYFGGDPRLPLLPASESDRSRIREILQTAGLLP